MAKRPSKRTNDPEGLRRRILDIAAELFQSRGYHATSMHDIQAEAGVTGGALHHHFATKKALGMAVIKERVFRQVEETWIQPVQAAKSAAEGIRTVFKGTIAELDQRGRVLGCPVNNLAIELSLADADFRQALHGVFQAWRDAIAQKLRDERNKDVDPEALATFVVATFSGALALAKTEQDTAPIRACARQLAQALPIRR
jgi:TetR/AcrR family transcriptional repressor of nem operon